METPSVDKHSPLTRPHSFASPARSHARHEHETKTKTNFPIGGLLRRLIPLNLRSSFVPSELEWNRCGIAPRPLSASRFVRSHMFAFVGPHGSALPMLCEPYSIGTPPMLCDAPPILPCDTISQNTKMLETIFHA